MHDSDASFTAGTEQTKRIYCREWRVQHRTIRATVSLPRLQLVNKHRPIFECPVCYSSNDKVPVCFWCKSTNPESTAAFLSSMPKQRTISAPMHIIYSSSCAKPTRQPVAVGTGLDLSGACAAPAHVNRKTDKLSVIYNPPCQKSFVPPPDPIPASVRSNCSRINRTAFGRSALLRRSSYNSTTSAVTTRTITTSSPNTNPVTTSDPHPLHHNQRLRHRRVDDLRRQRITASDILQQDHHQQQQQDDPSRRFHSLPLRRKGQLLRTTAGMIVKKTRVSALFRKDAVPILDTTLEPSSPTHVHSRQEKLKIRTVEEYPHHRRSTSKPTKTLPTLPDSTVPLAPHAVPLRYSPAPVVSSAGLDKTDTGYCYTLPTPPSFLSPFWYRPDQYANLPLSPSSPSTSSRQTSVRDMNMTDWSDGSQCRPSFHSYTRSDPFPISPTHQGSPRTWKTKMGGFLRTSINAVSGRSSR